MNWCYFFTIVSLTIDIGNPQSIIYVVVLTHVSFCRLIDPCLENGTLCEPTYSFRHTLSLTSNATLFSVSTCIQL